MNVMNMGVNRGNVVRRAEKSEGVSEPFVSPIVCLEGADGQHQTVIIKTVIYSAISCSTIESCYIAIH